MPRTGEQAIAEGLKKKAAGYSFPPNTCLKQQRLLFDVPSYDFTPGNGRDPWAIEAFDFAKLRHPETNPLKIPRGYPVFWRRAGRPGHIALSLGGGKCLTTDNPTSGRFGIVNIDTITKGWGMSLVGWTQDLNKVLIVSGAASTATPPTAAAPTPGGKFAQIDDLAIKLIHELKPGERESAAWKIHNIARAYR